MPQVVSKQFPKVLLHLKDKSAMSLNFKDLLDRCDDIEINVSEEAAIDAESSTKRQSKDKMWYDLRVGRITASNMKAVYATDLSNPSQSLVKKICYANKAINNEATKWGIEKQGEARDAFMRQFA